MRALESGQDPDMIGDCYLCGAVALGGQLSSRRETRSDGSVPWARNGDDQQESLCEGCYACVGVGLGALASGDQLRPDAPGGRKAHGRGRHGCDFCGAFIGNLSYEVELVPRQRRTAERRAVLQMHNHRVCKPCWTWGGDALRDWSASSAAERAHGQAPTLRPSAVLALGLGPGERAMLSAAAASAGVADVTCSEDTLGAFDADPSSVLYVAAPEATGVLCRTSEASHRRVVVVAALTDMAAASLALKAGAGAFVTAPLSTNQATGTWEQVLARASTTRDPRTGFAVLKVTPVQPAEAREYLVRLRNFDSLNLASGVWLLRRFLRGTDRVGIDESRNPAAVVDVTAAQLPLLLKRIADVVSPSVECVPVTSHAVAAPRPAMMITTIMEAA